MRSGNASNPVTKDDEKKEQVIKEERNEELWTDVIGQENGYSYKVQPFVCIDMYKAISTEIPLQVTVSNSESDNVSVLYEDPDWEDENCLPQSTLDAVGFVLGDEIDAW
jgi:hypothetical protein